MSPKELKDQKLTDIFKALMGLLKDPRTHKDAKKYETLTYMDILEKGLKVMDSTASSLSMDNHIPLVVFNLNKPGNIRKVVSGDSIGTTVKEK